MPSPTCPWSSLQSCRGPWGEGALFLCFVEGPGGLHGTSESRDFPITWTVNWVVNSPGKCPIKTHSHLFWENSSSLEKELKSEKEQRQALQRELQHEKDTSSLLRAELQQVEGLKKVRQTLVGRKRAFSISRSSAQEPTGTLSPNTSCLGSGSAVPAPS